MSEFGSAGLVLSQDRLPVKKFVLPMSKPNRWLKILSGVTKASFKVCQEPYGVSYLHFLASNWRN